MLTQLAVVALEHRGTADFLQIFVKQRSRLDQMSVGIDHGMIEAFAEHPHLSSIFGVHA